MPDVKAARESAEAASDLVLGFLKCARDDERGEGTTRIIYQFIAAHTAELEAKCERLEKALMHLRDRIGKNRWWILDVEKRNGDWRTVGEAVDEALNGGPQ